MSIKQGLCLFNGYGPASAGTRLRAERQDGGQWVASFPCTNKASDAFICRYKEPAGPDQPVVRELIQILSPCVLRRALKKQMTHGGGLCHRYAASLVIFMDADNTRPI